ncbi:MAG: HesA/MoeB/ThiF family protein [Desulfuromonadales bacterium]|nr:MAG: HesA/MoeB/ThiF family protein [Desulfuromonadales bacterium]
MELRQFLQTSAVGDLVPWAVQTDAAKRYDLTVAEVEEAILEQGLMPARYQRNRQTIAAGMQLRLFRSRVVVIGSGGLGGYIIEELARLGVGHLVVVDPDVFEEHNLNRQILSSPLHLGMPKVDVAAARVREINPAVTITPLKVSFSTANGREILEGADAVVDGLDSITSRRELVTLCREMAIPLVHGAIGGWYGQVATQLPGDDISPNIFGLQPESKGVEAQLGNPSFTPATVASLQVAETCKVLLGEGESLRHRVLFVNLLNMEFEEVRMDSALG